MLSQNIKKIKHFSIFLNPFWSDIFVPPLLTFKNIFFFFHWHNCLWILHSKFSLLARMGYHVEKYWPYSKWVFFHSMTLVWMENHDVEIFWLGIAKLFTFYLFDEKCPKSFNCFKIIIIFISHFNTVGKKNLYEKI